MHVVAMRKVHNREEALGITSSDTSSTLAAPEEEKRAPEESIYYHPTFNPTGAPPPGQPPKYRSSITPPAPPPSLPPAPMQAIYGPPVAGPPPPYPHNVPRPPTAPSYYQSPVPVPPYAPVMPRQLEIGGRHGVPLPPPRPTGPPPQQQQLQHPHHTTPPQQVDPLNPAAPGYTQRFGHQQPVNRHIPAEEPVQYPAPRPANYTPATVSAAPTVSIPEESKASSEPSPAAAPASFSAPPSIADIMRRRHMIQDAEAGPAMPAPESGPSLPDSDAYFCAPGPQFLPDAPSTIIDPAPKPKPPKVIKADAELVSLVPAALRVKRASNSGNQQPRAPNKIRRVDDSVEINSNSVAEKKSENSAAQSSIDDAYAAFMNEIQELGAFE